MMLVRMNKIVRFLTIITHNLSINKLVKFSQSNKQQMSKPTFQLDLINPKDPNVFKVLGISDERADEIADIVQTEYRKNTDFSESLNDMYAHLNSFNEVIFCTLAAARMHDQNKGQHLFDKLEELKAMMDLMKMSQELKK